MKLDDLEFFWSYGQEMATSFVFGYSKCATCLIMNIVAFKYLLKTQDISHSLDVKNEDLDTCRIIIWMDISNLPHILKIKE